MNNYYVIGIDGGGTKTLAVLYDHDGNELKRTLGSYSNFNMDEQKAKKHLEFILDELTEHLDSRDSLFIQMGISGYSGLKDKAQYEAELAETYHATVSIESDALIALYAIKKNEEIDAILMIGGTGSVLIYSDKNRHEQIGGYGQLLGDEGSAYHLSITALKRILNEYESDQPYSRLSQEIMVAIHANSHHDVKTYVYQHEKTDIAALSGQVISRLVDIGDEDAITLYKEEAMALVKQALAAYQKMKKPERVIVGMRGSFIEKNPLVKETIIKELESKINGFTLDNGQVETVKGAYYLALHKLSEVLI